MEVNLGTVGVGILVLDCMVIAGRVTQLKLRKRRKRIRKMKKIPEEYINVNCHINL